MGFLCWLGSEVWVIYVCKDKVMGMVWYWVDGELFFVGVEVIGEVDFGLCWWYI